MATGFDRRVLNLRGSVVPVIDLRAFYGYADADAPRESKLIIGRDRDRIIALEVDGIVTVYKQVQYKETPSLNPRLSDKKDTLDRLIDFADESGLHEHVLVVNLKSLMDNHLGMNPPQQPLHSRTEIKENPHGEFHTTE